MLSISRPDIDCKDITDYPAETRFVKLPIVPYLKLLPARDPDDKPSTVWEEINDPQVAMINAINNPKYRFICGALARRLGKTFIVNVIAQLCILVPGINVLIMSPNYTLSSISFELQRSFIKAFDLEVDRDSIKDKILRLSNGSEVRMGSVNTVDSCVGRSYNLIVFDEAALSEGGEDAFNISLRPTLDRPGSKAIFISTPRGKNNWFSKFYNRGWSDAYPEWCSMTADYTENKRMKEGDVAEARSTMSRAQFEQEYMANFSVYEGLIYELPQGDICEFDPRQDGIEYIAGIDPGYKDPTAFVAIAYDSKEGIFHIIDEYLESEAKTPQHAEAFKKIIDRHNIETIFIDSAAAQFAADLAYVYDIPTIRGKKDILPGIAYLQALVQQRRLRVSPHCKETLIALDQYQWDPNDALTKEKPLHKHSHIPDAIRYAIYTFTI